MDRLLLPGDPDFKTYSDDTKVDSRLVDRARLPIYASIDRDDPLDWFHTLRSHVPDAPDEVKSSHVLDLLDDLPTQLQRKIWNGLQAVRIAIVDPRAYADVWRELWRSHVGADFPEQELEYRAAKGDKLAQRLLEDYIGFISQAVVDDSLPARLDSIASVAASGLIYPGGSRPTLPPPTPVAERLGEASKSVRQLLRRAVDYSAKSAPAYSEAYARAMSPELVDPRHEPFTTPGRIIARRALKGLRASHAFDRGDSKMVTKLAQQRDRLARRLRSVDMGWGGPARVGVLAELDSANSYRVQAADIAAGIARQAYERGGLVEVIRLFNRVLLNGSVRTLKNLPAGH